MERENKTGLSGKRLETTVKKQICFRSLPYIIGNLKRDKMYTNKNIKIMAKTLAFMERLWYYTKAVT